MKDEILLYNNEKILTYLLFYKNDYFYYDNKYIYSILNINIKFIFQLCNTKCMRCTGPNANQC